MATIRAALDQDIAAIQAIYAYHVLNGIVSFEEVPPDLAEMGRRRSDSVARNLPFLVAESAGKVLGFAYSSPYRLRPAYRYTVEDSIYLSKEEIGRGIGRALLRRVVELSTTVGCRQMIAVIGDSANVASIHLHASLGFERVGLLASTGFKFGRWVDCVLMQRPLGQGDRTLPDIERTL